MKKCILYTIIFFSPLSSFSQAEFIIGKVKSIREKLIFLDSTIQNRKVFGTDGDYGHYGFYDPEFTFKRFNSSWFHTPWVDFINYYREFDEDSTLKTESWYMKNDSLYLKYIYGYDKNHNLIQEKTIYKNAIDGIKGFHYDDENRLRSTISYSFLVTQVYYYENYIYDDKMLLKEIKQYDEFGESFGKKFEYNNKRQKIKMYQHAAYVWIKRDDKSSEMVPDKKGNDQLLEEYFYNEMDSLSEIKYYIEDFYDRNKSDFRSRTLYKYDVKKRKIAEYYAVDTVEAGREYTYNDSGSIKSMKFIRFKDSTITFSIEYFYSIENDIKKVIYSQDGKSVVITFNYKFDSKHNWIEQLKSIDDKPLYLRKREIIYY